MATEIGEYCVGAWLKEIEGCDFVDYNVRPPGGGMKGLGEIDVIGLKLAGGRAYLCEAATHLRGLEYGGGYQDSAKRIREKFKRCEDYAADHLGQFPERRFMFWAPRVPKGKLLALLEDIDGLELVTNEDYTGKVDRLRKLASESARDTGNPFFRSLQLLGHLRTNK